jgi:hypothetical protein
MKQKLSAIIFATSLLAAAVPGFAQENIPGMQNDMNMTKMKDGEKKDHKMSKQKRKRRKSSKRKADKKMSGAKMSGDKMSNNN